MVKRARTEAERMAAVDEWPHWPYLPVKAKDGKKTGVLINTDLYDAAKLKFSAKSNIFAMSAESLSDAVPMTIDEMIKNGWIGD